MPLNKNQLKSNIQKALEEGQKDSARTAAQVAQDLANAIEVYVKSGDVVQVNTTVSVSVTTTGSASAQSGTGTGTGTQTGVGKIQ